jgi:hypothetical protein
MKRVATFGVLLLAVAVAATAALAGLAARPSNAVVYSVQATIEHTITDSQTWTGSPRTDPRQTCGPATITLKLNGRGKFFVAQPRSRSAPLVAANSRFTKRLYAGRHPSVPLAGQVTMTADLGAATADVCDGQEFPADRCERALPLRSMAFDPHIASWEIRVKAPPLTRTRCLDYVPIAIGDPLVYIANGEGAGYPLRGKLLRGRSFKLGDNVTDRYGQGSTRLTWTLTFTRLR